MEFNRGIHRFLQKINPETSEVDPVKTFTRCGLKRQNVFTASLTRLEPHSEEEAACYMIIFGIINGNCKYYIISILCLRKAAP